MSFSLYQHNPIKPKAGSLYAASHSLETVQTLLALGNEAGRIEAALLSLSFIKDCVVVESLSDRQQQERVAYIVSSEPFSPQRLHAQLQQILPTTPLPTTYVPVAVLPLTVTGEVDHQALNTRVGEENAVQLYQKSWHMKPLTGEMALNSTGQTLIFIDQLGLGSQLCDQLDQLNQSYILVELGSDFARLSDNHYYLNPVNPLHYQQLLEAILTEDCPITQIVHLWTYHRSFRAIPQEKALEYSLDLGVHSLEFLAQALAATQAKQVPVRLLVATNHTQAVQPWSRGCWGRNPEIRLLQTLSQEQSELHCCHLDLPEVELPENVNRILQELSTISVDLEVSYHQDRRWVAVVEPMKLNQVKPVGYE
jgi:hypothetical protein